MKPFTARAGRRSLARTIAALVVAGAFGACATEATAPTVNASSRAAANAAAPNPESYTTSVDLVVERVADSPEYGTTVRLGISCSTSQVFDVIIDLEQQVRVDKGKQLVQGSTTVTAYPCDQDKTSLIAPIAPTNSKLGFEPGRATVRARIGNYQPGVEPADITTRTRIVVE